MRRLAAESAVNTHGPAESENASHGDTTLLEGLSSILSGINTNMSKAFRSAPMAHIFVSNGGSRFQFSHKFTNLIVSQLLDVLN